jgi:hypothetical protein
MKHLSIFEDFNKKDEKINSILELIDKEKSPIFVVKKSGDGLFYNLEKNFKEKKLKYIVIQLNACDASEIAKAVDKCDIVVFEDFYRASIVVRDEALEYVTNKNKIYIYTGKEDSLDDLDTAIKNKFTIVK